MLKLKVADENDELIDEDDRFDEVDNKDQFSSVQMNTLYYICGAALRSMLGIVLDDDLRNHLLGNFTISLSKALELKLPCSKINDEAIIRDKESNEIQLIYASKTIFECILEIERDILVPIFGNLQLLASVGNGFYDFIRRQFRSHNSFTTLEDLFLMLLR